MVSGVVMKAAPEFFQTTPEGFDLREVDVRLARADEVCRWNRVVDRHHYLGFKQFAGRGLRYVFTWRGHWIGAAGWQTGAFKCAPRDRWIGWRRDEQFARLHLIGNNTRFVILGGRRVFLGLASFALSRMVRRLSDDWEAAYGNPLLVAESFVAPTRFSGTMYKAANWTRVGASKGYARASGRYTDRHGEVKDLYVFPLRRDACRRLRDRALLPAAWELKAQQSGRSAQELRSIYQHFAELSDYRRAQGRKHSIASVLCVILLARLANRHGPVAAARYAKRMTQKELEQIGAWKNKATGRYEPVSKSTVHRVLQNTDPSWIEDALQRWAQPRLQVGRAIAIDGKRIRGANRTPPPTTETEFARYPARLSLAPGARARTESDRSGLTRHRNRKNQRSTHHDRSLNRPDTGRNQASDPITSHSMGSPCSSTQPFNKTATSPLTPSWHFLCLPGADLARFSRLTHEI